MAQAATMLKGVFDHFQQPASQEQPLRCRSDQQPTLTTSVMRSPLSSYCEPFSRVASSQNQCVEGMNNAE